jgi:DNA-binding NarL/FixJ family response regulator
MPVYGHGRGLEMKQVHENIAERTNNVNGLHQGAIELLRSGLNLLTGTDKLLMTMYIEHGNSIRQIARIRGVCETSVARRVRAIIKRLTDGPYIDCLRNRDKLTSRQLAVAKDYYLMGLSMRQIAAKRRWSYYCVRETLNEIRSIVTAPQRRTG